MVNVIGRLQITWLQIKELYPAGQIVNLKNKMAQINYTHCRPYLKFIEIMQSPAKKDVMQKVTKNAAEII